MEETNRAAIEYLQLLLKYHMKNEDFENFIDVKAYLQEYITSIFKISDLFQSTFIYSGISYPLKHEFAVKSFLIENQKNYLFYESLSYPHLDFATQLSSLFSYPLKTRLKSLAFQILDLEQTQEILTQYPIFFNHLLSIASMLYFTELSLDEKLELLNSTYELNNLIDLLQKNDYEWDFINWKFSSTSLLHEGHYELALHLNQIIIENHFDKIRDEDKYILYDGLGTIHRNLENYDKACEHYQEAYKWIDKASIKDVFPLVEERDIHKLNINNDYQKGICLKNIGESFGHKGDYNEMTRKFTEAENIIKNLNQKYEKFSLYFNLSVASRRLYKFENERNYINRALEFVDESTPLQQIEHRIDIFGETEMSSEKLIQIEKKEKIHNYIKIGKFLSQINNFKLSVSFYKKALKVSEEVSERIMQKIFQIEIFRGMGISYFLLREWEKSKKFLMKYLALEEDFESELYYFIVLYLTGELERSKDKLIDIIKGFKESSGRLMLINDWFIQIMNCFGKKTFLGFINLIESLDDEFQEFVLYKFGNALAGNGFSELAIQFFKRELDFIKDDKIKATIFNDIGGIYSDLDEYENAIEYFKKALELDKEYDRCYRNLAEIYSRKLDNINAKQSLEKAIEIAKKKGKPEFKLYERELENIKQLLENVLNINDITSQEIKNILITAERKLIDYRNKNDDFDASDIILGYSRALERMLNEQVASHFELLIQKYRETRKKTSEDFNKKFSVLFHKKTISLGTWNKFLKDFQKNLLEPDVKEFKEHLESKFNKGELKSIHAICDTIVEERNEIAHGKVINIKQVILIRKGIVPFFNQVINVLYK